MTVTSIILLLAPQGADTQLVLCTGVSLALKTVLADWDQKCPLPPSPLLLPPAGSHVRTLGPQLVWCCCGRHLYKVPPRCEMLSSRSKCLRVITYLQLCLPLSASWLAMVWTSHQAPTMWIEPHQPLAPHPVRTIQSEPWTKANPSSLMSHLTDIYHSHTHTHTLRTHTHFHPLSSTAWLGVPLTKDVILLVFSIEIWLSYLLCPGEDSRNDEGPFWAQASKAL